METHVKVLGALNIAFGALGLLGAVVLLLVFGAASGAVGAAGAQGEPGAVVALPIIGITGIALVVFLLILSAPGIIIGVGLFNLRPWARIGGIVLSIISLMAIPLGTLVGIYGLWVLFSKDTERLFTTPAPGGST